MTSICQHIELILYFTAQSGPDKIRSRSSSPGRRSPTGWCLTYRSGGNTASPAPNTNTANQSDTEEIRRLTRENNRLANLVEQKGGKDSRKTSAEKALDS